MARLEEAIHQKAFADERIKVDIKIMFTASWLATIKARALKDMGISWQQFNILRILKGAHPRPATVKYLAERMIDQTSNASRLVDKLVDKKMVTRTICPHDRRQVEINLTEKGMDDVATASEVLESGLRAQLNHLSVEEAMHLNQLLDKIRQ